MRLPPLHLISRSRAAAAWRDSTLRGVRGTPLAGDRAPPRGVDVKQPPPGRPRGAQGPGEASPSLPEASGDLGSQIPRSGVSQSPSWYPRPGRRGLPGSPGSGFRTRRGLLLHQPLAAGPCASPRGLRDPGSPRTSPRPPRRPPGHFPPRRDPDPRFPAPGRGQGPAARG